jgi:hypothetical protein
MIEAGIHTGACLDLFCTEKPHLRKLFPFAIIAILVGGCAGAIIRPTVEDAIKRSLPDYIGPAKHYDVKTTGSATEILGGKLASIRIEGEDVQVDPELTITKLLVEMKDVRVDTGTRAMKSVGSTAIHATISEAAVNKYIVASRGTSDLSVKLERSKIQVSFTPRVGGIGVPLSVTGKLAITGGDKVNFEADAASMGRIPVSAYVINKGLAAVNPVIDLSTMKFPVTIESITLRAGAADVMGSAKFSPGQTK